MKTGSAVPEWLRRFFSNRRRVVLRIHRHVGQPTVFATSQALNSGDMKAIKDRLTRPIPDDVNEVVVEWDARASRPAT